ncbi:hypothetical protein WJX73_002213 [Symbiochloris irregularis]|uniref:Uncharacterized protein n=1 Tax=Symbiochloris irregularis TaxID=706552 RepID=A0AAW1PVS7_9CHLO
MQAQRYTIAHAWTAACVSSSEVIAKDTRPASRAGNCATSTFRGERSPGPAVALPPAFKRRHQHHLASPPGAIATLLGFWQHMFDLLLSARIFTLLTVLFVAPVLWDVVTDTSLENEASVLSIRSYFAHNVRGENINQTPSFAKRMVQHPERHVRAAIVVVARNQDCDDVLLSMTRMEQRFNAKFLYPYVFLNNDGFDDAFRNRTSAATKAETLYGLIPKEHWSYPPWINPQEAATARRKMVANGVLYGGRESYHHMCRYFSGFFFRHPLLARFDFYWRMEPDVHYYCDLDYDPFLYMQENALKYGFVIAAVEGPKTIPSLWGTVQKFAKEHSGLVVKDNLLPWVTSRDGGYNLCHFWSNFEIGDLNFFRSEEYLQFFDYLDRQGGFFFERWGDAPVHSLAAALFLNHSEVHFFQDIGYRHNSMRHCPSFNRNHCACDAQTAVRYHKASLSFGRCHKAWDDFVASKQPRHLPAGR